MTLAQIGQNLWRYWTPAAPTRHFCPASLQPPAYCKGLLAQSAFAGVTNQKNNWG